MKRARVDNGSNNQTPKLPIVTPKTEMTNPLTTVQNNQNTNEKDVVLIANKTNGPQSESQTGFKKPDNVPSVPPGEQQSQKVN